MSKINRKRRQFEIKKKRERREKIKKLKGKYLMAKNEEEKNKILEKIKKIAPQYPVEEILKMEK